VNDKARESLRIAIGSTSPVKTAGTTNVLREFYPDAQFMNVEVATGIPSQPWGERLSRRGAVERARRALEETGADLGVGLEGGVVETEWGLMTTNSWCAIVDRAGHVGIGGSTSMRLPPAIERRMRQGGELGQAIEGEFGELDSTQKIGAAGFFSAGLTNRQTEIEHSVRLSLTRFIRANLFDEAPEEPAPPTPLISACLAGLPCRYDGGTNTDHRLQAWAARHGAAIICPEVAGGLATPRPPAEIVGGDGNDVLDGRAQVMTIEGRDVTGQFLAGAEAAARLAIQSDATVAILKERSPSCGVETIHDGHFGGGLRAGSGVTGTLLRRRGLLVLSEHQERRWGEAATLLAHAKAQRKDRAGLE